MPACRRRSVGHPIVGNGEPGGHRHRRILVDVDVGAGAPRRLQQPGIGGVADRRESGGDLGRLALRRHRPGLRPSAMAAPTSRAALGLGRYDRRHPDERIDDAEAIPDPVAQRKSPLMKLGRLAHGSRGGALTRAIPHKLLAWWRTI